MARVPRVESPCPIAGKQLPAGATEHCTRCDRTVHNLDRMSERERHEFMGACRGQVCVAYTVRIPLASIRKRHGGGLAMATLAAASIVSLPAATQTPETQTVEPPTGAMSSYLARLVSGGTYRGIREAAKQLAKKLPKFLYDKAAKASPTP